MGNKRFIQITGSIQKKNLEELTEFEREEFYDAFIAFVESNDLTFLGITTR